MTILIQYDFFYSEFGVEGGVNIDDGLAWRGIILTYGQSIRSLQGVIQSVQAAIDYCGLLSLAEGICKAPIIAVRVLFEIIVFALDITLNVVKFTYGETATPSDQVGETAFIKGREDATYENVITNHGNIITTFRSTLQLKQLLGGVLDNQEEDDEGNDRRRRLESKSCTFEQIDSDSDCTCVLTKDSGYISGCTKPACEDIKRLCNGAFNYKYIADQRQGELLMIHCKACLSF